MTEEPMRPILAPALRSEPMVIPGCNPVPVILLTGFLGAGKTILLDRTINGQHGLRVGMLVSKAINAQALRNQFDACIEQENAQSSRYLCM